MEINLVLRVIYGKIMPLLYLTLALLAFVLGVRLINLLQKSEVAQAKKATFSTQYARTQVLEFFWPPLRHPGC